MMMMTNMQKFQNFQSGSCIFTHTSTSSLSAAGYSSPLLLASPKELNQLTIIKVSKKRIGVLEHFLGHGA
jgi:hypothetical protein